MVWNEFYNTLAVKSLKVDICQTENEKANLAEYVSFKYSPDFALSSNLDREIPAYSIGKTMDIPLLPITSQEFDLDREFFRKLDAIVPYINDCNHVVDGRGDKDGYPIYYFTQMYERIASHGFAPANIFISEVTAKEIKYSMLRRDIYSAEINLKHDADSRIFGTWRNITIWKTDKLHYTMMYMTTFPNFLGVLPIKHAPHGPSDIGIEILEPYGVAKTIL